MAHFEQKAAPKSYTNKGFYLNYINPCIISIKNKLLGHILVYLIVDVVKVRIH